MRSDPPTPGQFQIGDPVPWFDAQTVAGASINLGVVAGRWVALCFLNELDLDAEATRVLAELLGEAKLFNDDHLVFYGVVTEPPQQAAMLSEVSHKALGFIADYTGAITREFGAAQSSRLLVLDPLLRVFGNFEIGRDGTPVEIMRKFLRDLPAVEDSAGVPLTAPALIVPRVFEQEFCDFLIDLYEKNGGVDSGFMLDTAGKTATVLNYQLKRRSDMVIVAPDIREMMRERVAKRLIPAIERFFQYRPTRMDRYLVSCYEAETGGHFSRHRDNVNAGARHRRFAVTMNLNKDYDGCDLMFPEFGRRLYRAPVGGAIVFSTGALHQVTPVTRGRRYAFIPFLYGEEEARQREANNALLQDGESLYAGGRDKLFPNA
ncbi:MAG: 2OG-Fe(II) oxygenase [Pseudomonadota bacterium]|nr:2OG-Fe(II) oxygenase [Pseudomonadota bacterium]